MASIFPASASEPTGHIAQRRAPAWRLTARPRGRVADIGNPYTVVAPIVGLFRQSEGNYDQPLTTRSRLTVNTLPPVSASGEILKGHGGDVPRGHGL
eukprot:CAMPEP_0170570134 /NCGR_PEP_ID=MMETSP0224-20130122/941_1 /TAXON_ID=285029 /ORGANISM="Togula jolla, Strain CCCM 725" /LENGTH=96 /DNA_ID=CAMNT_0010892377 /DNA_START=247 /DNA_END=534 /DNA_ORIENTATION=-